MLADAPERQDAGARRSVVPPAAGRSLWLAAVWTGAGAAVLCAVVAIGVVAICWLPAAGTSGHAGSAIRAGVLTFLAALHGGITVAGLSTAFVPLGLTLLVGLVAWRAGAGLADAAHALGEERVARLVQVGATQAGVFALGCGVGAGMTSLGTTSVTVLPATLSAAVLFAATGGVAFVRWSPLREIVVSRLPSWAGPVTRGAAAGIGCYLGAGAVLVAGALVIAHDRVEALSALVGGGWSGAPILLLGMLAAPNAAIAGLAYLAGPGFAVGSGTHVSLFTTAQGTLPAFPLLGGVPTGHGAPWPVWIGVVGAALLAGACVARVTARAPGWGQRFRDTAAVAILAGVLGGLLAWLGGGAIGSGRLNAVGASPWRVGFALATGLGVAAAFGLGLLALGQRVQRVRHARADRRHDAIHAAQPEADTDGDADADADVATSRVLRAALRVIRNPEHRAEEPDDDVSCRGDAAGPDHDREVAG